MTSYYRRVGYKVPTLEINVGGTIAVSRGSPPQPLIITANTAPSPAQVQATVFEIVGPDGLTPLAQIDSFGTGVDSVFRQTAARGTATAPTALQANDFIGEHDFRGYAGAATNNGYSAGTGLNVQAIENFTTAAQGTKLNFSVIGQGTTAVATALTVTGATAVSTGLQAPLVPASTSYANDAAAAAGGVPVGGVYRNGSALQCRVS